MMPRTGIGYETNLNQEQLHMLDFEVKRDAYLKGWLRSTALVPAFKTQFVDAIATLVSRQ
jgi:hypothetical protein